MPVPPRSAPQSAPPSAPPSAARSRLPRPVVDKSDDPFPPSLQFRILRFHYGDAGSNPPALAVPEGALPQPAQPAPQPSPPRGDHLQLVRYNARPLESDPTSDWQLRTGYTVWIDIDFRDEANLWRAETWALTAPRGMYTDLSSIPAFARWIVSKSGPHLEASIIHDWLYLKWTDHRFDNKRFSDWVFADAVLAAGLRELKGFHWFRKRVITFAVQTAGWLFFFRKAVPLKILLPRWEQHLTDYPDDTPVPPDEQAKPVPPTLLSRTYAWGILLFSLAVALLGLMKIWTTVAGWLDGGLGFPAFLYRWNTLGPGAEVAAAIGQGAGLAILFVLGTLGIVLTLAVAAWAAGRTLVGMRRALGG